MTKYDFDRVIDRRGTDCTKWSFNEKLFGASDVLSMWIADMDLPSPAPVIDAIIQRAQHGVYGYQTRGDSHYDPLIDWLHRRQSWKIQREWIAPSPGVVVGLNLAVQTFTHPGDKIIIQPPVYPPFFSVPKNNGRRLVFNPLKIENGHYRMDLIDLQQKIDRRTKLLILCSPHNPVGRVWTREELLELGELCARKNVLIVSDEIHSDLVLRGHTHTPLAALSAEIAANTLTFVAPSKTFNLAGLYTSAAIIPNPRLLAEFNTALENTALNSSTVFGQVAFEAAYRHGEEWLEQLLDYVQGNVDFARRYFQEHIPRIKVTNPEGTYLLWLDCRELGLDHVALKKWMLKKAKVALVDGRLFGVGGDGFMRMNIGCPRAIVEEGLKRIESAVNNL